LIDLHTHTLFSDGELGPAELVRRATVAGYRALALTDHVDHSNYNTVVPQLVQFCRALPEGAITVLPGVEITHVPPEKIGELAALCRRAGARVVVVHGETIVEPVAPGTNRAAIEAQVDILAHPGLISGEEARLAAAKGVALEISGRGGHCFTNGHVAAAARRAGAALVFNTDAHAPRDLMPRALAESAARGAGMDSKEVTEMFAHAARLAERLAGV